MQPRRKESLLTCLADLFNSIATQKKKVGVIPPKKFISRLRKENGGYRYSLILFCKEAEGDLHPQVDVLKRKNVQAVDF